ncbi:MAG: fibronectin type III domain-containing protein, partial [Methanomassiliicoccales archaeon]|nr:fibronectin type III domain-containing protein [Methanomassiliicoccales archaeon]
DVGLTNGQTYVYNVAASNSIGWSPNSSSLSVIPQGPPSAPLSLEARPGNGMVQLGWTAPEYIGPGSLIYHLYRNGVLVWSGVGLAHADTELANFVTYTYELAASNSIGWGPNSTAVQAMPLPDEMTPTAPYGIEVLEGNGLLTLAWQAPVYSNASTVIGYSIWYGTSPGSLSGQTSSNQPSCMITNLVKGTVYYLQVAALNNAGWGYNSSIASGTPFGVPNSPSGLDAEAGDSHVLLSWDAPDYLGPGAIIYHLFRDGDLVWSGEELEHDDASLENGITYRYDVAAENQVGWGATSIAVQATPFAVVAEPPGPPKALQAVAGDGQVELSWEPPDQMGSAEINGYKIYRGVSPGSLSLLTTGTSSSYVDNDVTNDLTYYYQVSAFSEAGEGTPSELVSATPAHDDAQGGPDLIVIAAIVAVAAIILVAAAVLVMRRRG